MTEIFGVLELEDSNEQIADRVEQRGEPALILREGIVVGMVIPKKLLSEAIFDLQQRILGISFYYALLELESYLTDLGIPRPGVTMDEAQELLRDK